MDELTKLLRGMAPGQIQEAVQLLQQYTATNRQTEKGEQTSTGNDTNGSSINGESSSSTGQSQETNKDNNVSPSVGTPNGDNTLSSVIALALRQAASGSVNTSSNTVNGIKDEYEDEDDIPLALLLQSRQGLFRKKSNRSTAQKKTLEDTTNNELNGQQENEQQQQQQKQQEQQQSTEENRTPNRKGGKSSGKALNNQQQTSPSNTACGLANFGFLSAAKKPTVPSGDKNKLFTPFVQDKRIVPAALQFWNQKSDRVKEEEEQQQLQLPAHIREEEEVSVVRHTIAVDEDTSSLMHSPVLGFSENEEQHQQEGEGEGEEGKKSKSKSKQKGSQLQGGRTRCYASFGDMIDSVTYVTPSLHCPCGFHVHTPAPRVGFCDEVVFCGFYAVGYDPCQSRPPYFGTHNSQDSYNKEELLRLARFPVGTAMPQMSNLDYQYDSGDDWDVVDGDEDIGASSSDSDDDAASGDSNSCNSNSSNAFMGDSEDDFINDNDEDDDSDAELQRKMVEARQRRLNRLRHKDKLVPAFSGPFVGLAMIDHPLREYDRLDRVSSTLDGPAFTALLEQELRATGTITSATSAIGGGINNNNNNSGVGVGGGADKVNGNDIITNNNNNINNGVVTMVTDIGNEELLEQQQQQRLLAAALRNRREMLPEELDALHVIIAANGKISFKAIVEALQQQQLCVGVARAEILRTISRYYERKHNTMVRRDEPWSATDERLYARQERRKAAKKNKINNNNNNTNDNNNNDDGGREKSGDYQGEDSTGARAISGGRGEMDNNNNNNNNDYGDGEEDGVESDEDSEENITLVALASKRPRSESRENNSV